MSEPKTEIEKMKNFYDEVYYKDANKPLQGSSHLNKLAQQLSIQKGQKVLDIACGRGEWLHTCSQKGAIQFGIDLSDRAIDFCKKHLPNGEFYAQPAEQLPFEDNMFDFVSCLGSLEHFVAPVDALKEMVRVAKPRAKFLILVPNADFLTRKLKLYYGTNQKDAKEVVRTLQEWESLFNQAGLKVNKKWKDLHVISWHWITMRGFVKAPVRFLQAIALAFWPLKWQYQVYHLCEIKQP